MHPFSIQNKLGGKKLIFFSLCIVENWIFQVSFADSHMKTFF